MAIKTKKLDVNGIEVNPVISCDIGDTLYCWFNDGTVSKLKHSVELGLKNGRFFKTADDARLSYVADTLPFRNYVANAYGMYSNEVISDFKNGALPFEDCEYRHTHYYSTGTRSIAPLPPPLLCRWFKCSLNIYPMFVENTEFRRCPSEFIYVNGMTILAPMFEFKPYSFFAWDGWCGSCSNFDLFNKYKHSGLCFQNVRECLLAFNAIVKPYRENYFNIKS